MNFFQLIQQFCYSPGVGEDPPSSFNDTDEETIKYKQYLNDSNSEIIASRSWNFKNKKQTINTISGQREYDKAGLVAKVYYNGTPLKFIDDECLLSDSLGQPAGYYINHEENKIGLHPIPDNTYAIKIKLKTDYEAISAPPESLLKEQLILETDSSIIPSKFNDLIVKGAEIIYMRDKNKNITLALKKYQDRLNELIEYDRGTLEADPKIVMG